MNLTEAFQVIQKFGTPSRSEIDEACELIAAVSRYRPCPTCGKGLVKQSTVDEGNHCPHCLALYGMRKNSPRTTDYVKK